ncbi:MAG: peptidoglycan DD-metalloendopeptidase family protein [Paracoccaceae bacterium]
MIFTGKTTGFIAALMAVSFLSACEGMSDFKMPSFGLRTDSNVDTAPPAINRPQPDGRGVITYETYQVMVARSGDTVGAMAGRVGLSPEALARHNGLELSYAPRAGELFALPGNVGGNVVASPTGWSPEIAATAISNATGGGIGGSTPSVGTPNEPLRHRVESGDTAYSIARLYNVSVTALASWNGLGADLGVRAGQELIIPVPDTAQMAVAAPTAVATPTPTPVVTPTVAPTPTPAPVAVKFIPPVNGPIARPYNPQPGGSKNDGIDFSAPAGTAVHAAAAGTVALVSKSTGGLGTIVLIRHANGILTIYGRVDKVSVSKNDRVSQGQTIGVVAAGNPATVHFEVRKGSDSVDPTPYLK